MNELFGIGDFEDSGKQDKLLFPENIPVKMKIVETKDGVLEKSGYPYYVLCCTVLNGDHAGQDYDLFINTVYKTKSGEKVSHGFKKVLQGFCKDFAVSETKEGRGDDLPETFRTQLEQIIGDEIEAAFFKPDNGYQNLIYVKSLTAKEEAIVEEVSGEVENTNTF